MSGEPEKASLLGKVHSFPGKSYCSNCSNTPNIPNDTRMQFVRLMEICDENCMLQIVEEETRGKNTLDLIYTNEVSLVTDIDLNKSAISDHH